MFITVIFDTILNAKASSILLTFLKKERKFYFQNCKIKPFNIVLTTQQEVRVQKINTVWPL